MQDSGGAENERIHIAESWHAEITRVKIPLGAEMARIHTAESLSSEITQSIFLFGIFILPNLGMLKSLEA